MGASATTATEGTIDYLVATWRRVFRLMTIDQALVGRGLAPTWELRSAIADHLDAGLDRSPVLRRWGVGTIALSNDERLLGRALAEAGGRLPLADLAVRRGLDVDSARNQLRMLCRYGIVSVVGQDVVLADDYEAKLGPLGWHFHVVQLDDEPPFNVPCAVDFLLLAHGAYPDRHLALRDTCARSATPIRVEATGGAIVAVEPSGALVFRGGG